MKTKVLIGCAVAALLLTIAHAVDARVWQSVHGQWIAGDAQIMDRWRIFRAAGYAPTWALIIAAMMLIGWPGVKQVGWRIAWRTPVMLFCAVALNAVLAEVCKIMLRRMRPEQAGGEYVFRPWSERTFDTGGLGLPSSHATIAFAAMFMLMRLYPRAWPVWWVIGIGCALQRVVTGAHFVSDVTAAGIVAWLGVAAIWQLDQWRNRVK